MHKCFQRGRRACEAFLKYYAAAKNLPPRMEANGDVTSDTTKPDTSSCTMTSGGRAERRGVEEEEGNGEVEMAVSLQSVLTDTERFAALDTALSDMMEMTCTDEKSPCQYHGYFPFNITGPLTD